MKKKIYEIVAGADNSRAVEPETIQKNGASPKSHTSRRNFLMSETGADVKLF